MSALFDLLLCLGIWADGIIIQAVADVLNLKVHIIESQPDFAEITVAEALTNATLRQEQHTIFIGPVEEFHFASTSPSDSSTTLSIDDNSYLQVPEETELI